MYEQPDAGGEDEMRRYEIQYEYTNGRGEGCLKINAPNQLEAINTLIQWIGRYGDTHWRIKSIEELRAQDEKDL